jgi:hypothetical protein
MTAWHLKKTLAGARPGPYIVRERLPEPMGIRDAETEMEADEPEDPS